MRCALVPAHAEEPPVPGNGLGLRRLSHAREPQRWQTAQAEAAVRGLAGEGLAYRDSRALPQAVRHRNQLSATAAGADLYLHPPTPLAIAVCRRGALKGTELAWDACVRCDHPATRSTAGQVGTGSELAT